MNQNEKTTIAPTDYAIGEIVTPNTANPNNMRIYGLPAFLIGGTLTVVGYTKKKVKCDWDGGKPYHIPPELLKSVGKASLLIPNTYKGVKPQ